jgi:hypothetical protein
MFCQRCGRQLEGEARFCGSCGFPVAGGAIASVTKDPLQALGNHLRILGILWAIYSVFRIVIAGWALVFNYYFLPMVPQFIPREAGAFAFPILHFLRGIYVFSSVYSLAIGILGVWTAWALLQRERSGRTVALIAGFISLISIPFGTALGVYTLVVLLPQTAGQNYDRLTAPR